MANEDFPPPPMGVRLRFTCLHCERLTPIWSPDDVYTLLHGMPLTCAHCDGLTMLKLEAIPRLPTTPREEIPDA